MGHDQVAAGRDGIHQPRHDRVRVVGVGDEVQDRDEQDSDRAGEIEGVGGALEDRVGVPQVGLDVVGLAFGGAGQQGLGVAVTGVHAGARLVPRHGRTRTGSRTHQRQRSAEQVDEQRRADAAMSLTSQPGQPAGREG